MTRTHVTIAGGVLLGVAAIFAGVSLARTAPAQQVADSAAAAPAWDFPLPPVSGSGYSSLDGVAPNGAWPVLPGRLRGPVQPIFYRHDVHAGQYRIPCL